MRWARHAVCMESVKFILNIEEKRDIGRRLGRWKDIIKIDLTDIERDSVD
jgi:hypothetical protein